ncbi:contractile injection system tape measure protein [Celerinatantimonas yamalensis]|uniref:Contractile injection system tape measure protein n=1 Tax=Celerinatantimonas yamalensis TaxID=559956 RepID=A0ABW9G2D3_9GAMM
MKAFHKIAHARLTLNFETGKPAEQFERQSHQWVSQQLLPMLERVFDRFNPSDEVITIDKLELNLGNLNTESLLSQLLTAIEAQLTVQLTSLLTSPAIVPNSVHRYASKDYRFEQALMFLQTGQLPWNINSQSHLSQLDLIPAMISHIDQLEHYLAAQPSNEVLLARMIYQLPTEDLARLFTRLSAANQSRLIQRLVASDKQHHPRLKQTIEVYYHQQLTHALTHHDLSLLMPYAWPIIGPYSHVLLAVLQAHHLDPRLPDTLVRQLTPSQRFSLLRLLEPSEYPFLYLLLNTAQLWVHSAATPSAATASKIAATPHLKQQLWRFTLYYLLVERGSRFNKQTYLQGVLYQMAAHQNMAVAALIHMLRQTLQQSAIDSRLREQMQTMLNEIDKTPKQDLIAIPEIETMSSAVRRHWLHHQLVAGEISPDTLDWFLRHDAALLISTLRGLNVNTLSAQRLLSELPFFAKQALLTTIEPDIEQNSTSQETIEAHWRQHFSLQTRATTSEPITIIMALRCADEVTLLAHWPSESTLLSSILRWMGQLAAIRQTWAEGYSDPTLIRLAIHITPAAGQIIQDIIHHPRIWATFETQPVDRHSTRVSYWQFTLGYLILEHESEFNRRSYLTTLTARMAARRNISQTELIRAMLQVASPSSQSILYSLLNEQLRLLSSHSLSTTQPLERSLVNQPNYLAREQIVDALLTADQPIWQQLYHNMLHQDPLWLRTQIVTLGELDNYQRLWAEQFPDSTLLKLVIVIDSSAHPTVASVIHHHHYFAVITSHPIALKQSIWQLTFAYLLSDRGSEFNRHSYLKSLVQQLAARHNVSARQLIDAMLQTSTSPPDWLIELTIVYSETSLSSSPDMLAWLKAPMAHWVIPLELSATHRRAVVEQFTQAAAYWPLQQLSVTNQQRLIKLLVPKIADQLITWLHTLSILLEQLPLPANWFYQRALAADPPRSIHAWLLAILSELHRQLPSQSEAQRIALLQSVIEHHVPISAQTDWLKPLKNPLQALQQWLQTDAPLPNIEQRRYILLNHGHSLWPWLSIQLQSPPMLRRWITALSDQEHRQLFATHYPQLLAYIDWLAQTLTQQLADTGNARSILWHTLYHQLLLLGGQEGMYHLIRRIQAALFAHPYISAHAPLKQSLLTTQRADSRYQWLTLENIKATAPPKPPDIEASIIGPLQEAITQRPCPILSQTDDTPADGEPISIDNAGMVLAAPYLANLFQRLGLTDGKQFASPQTQEQALFCLQQVVYGQHEAPEYRMMLNKVLCGMPLTMPIPADHLLPDGAELVIDGMLNAMRAHWQALGSTSIDGLRSTFLQRSGTLIRQTEHWQLNIAPGTFDMLLDQLPWSYQTIKYPWMDKPMFVSWR